MQPFYNVNGATFDASLLIVSNEDGEAIIFTDFDAAKEYQDNHGISGRVVKIPTY